MHFDDLLSVVNDAQLKSALNTYKEITQLMKRASEQRKRKAGDKLTVGTDVLSCEQISHHGSTHWRGLTEIGCCEQEMRKDG